MELCDERVDGMIGSGATVVLRCQTRSCTAEVQFGLDLDGAPERLSTGGIVEDIDDGWPDDWGYDTASNGLDRVLHCPLHRTYEGAGA